MSQSCYLPIEYLEVVEETPIFGIRLLPLGHPGLPAADPPWFILDDPVGCVAVVAAQGSDDDTMLNNAQEHARYVLRILRVALREHHGVHDHQLRFRLGSTHKLGTRSGWSAGEGVSYKIGLDSTLLGVVHGQPLSTLPALPNTDIKKKADLALRWIERAWFADDALVALLYLFFSLEVLLGDKSEGLKAHNLAFRQAMLGHIAEGGFAHPSKTLFLYVEVRSGAVHGEDVPDVSWDMVHTFAWTVRNTLNHYLKVAQENNFQRRGRLLKFLDRHADRPQLIAWLRKGGGGKWTRYLDGIDTGESLRSRMIRLFSSPLQRISQLRSAARRR